MYTSHIASCLPFPLVFRNSVVYKPGETPIPLVSFSTACIVFHAAIEHSRRWSHVDSHSTLHIKYVYRQVRVAIGGV